MLQFTQPTALWWLAILAVPLVIHLLNRKEGPVIRVGSIRLLEQVESTRLRSPRMEEKALWLWRSLLLSLFALALAGPVWHGRENASEPAGWVLISPELLHTSATPSGLLADHRGTIESILASGHQLRLLAPGFPPLRLDNPPESPALPEDVWSLLREARHLNPGAPLWLYSANLASGYRGQRPDLDITWQTVTLDGENRWMNSAWVSASGKPMVDIAFGNAEGVAYERYVVDPDQSDLFRVNRENGMAQVALTQPDLFAGDDQIAVPMEELPTHLIVYDQGRREDAGYVAAALRAYSRTMDLNEPRQLELSQWTQATNADLVFWLAETAPPPAFFDAMATQGILILDAGSTPYETTSATIHMPASLSLQRPSLHRRVSFPTEGLPLWMDSSGQPVLSQSSQDSRRQYRFHSRFHPRWSNLVLHEDFPHWIAGLALQQFEGKVSGKPVLDPRVLPENQTRPHPSSTQESSLTQQEPKRKFGHWLWLMAAAVFVVERWWSERRVT